MGACGLSFLVVAGHVAGCAPLCQPVGAKREVGMKTIRMVLRIAGLLLTALGLWWLGQGTGTIRWPASGAMVGDQLWVTLGAGVAVVGLVLILLSRRLR